MICLDSRCLFTSSLWRKLAPQMLHNQRPDDWSLCMLAYAKSSSSSKESWTLSPVKRGCKKINYRLNRVFVFYSCWLLIWTLREFLVLDGLLQTGQYNVGSKTCLDSMCLLMSSLSRESASQILHIHRPDVGSLCWFSVMKSSSCSWVKWTLSATKCF